MKKMDERKKSIQKNQKMKVKKNKTKSYNKAKYKNEKAKQNKQNMKLKKKIFFLSELSPPCWCPVFLPEMKLWSQQLKFTQKQISKFLVLSKFS